MATGIGALVVSWYLTVVYDLSHEKLVSSI